MPAKKKHRSLGKSDYWFIKFLFLCTILLGLLLSFMSYQRKTPSKPIDVSVWKENINKTAGYSIRYPNNWGVRDVEPKLFEFKDRQNLISYTGFSSVYFSQPTFGKGTLEMPNGDPVLTVKNVRQKALIKIVDEAIASLPHGGPDIKLKDERIRKIDGVDAILLITDTVVADPKVSDFAYFFVKNGILYTYSYLSPNGEPLPIPEAILSTFKFTE